MNDTTHDPPVRTAGRTPIDPARLAALRGPGFEKYLLMREKVGQEPIFLIQDMQQGRYQHKQVRGKPGVLRRGRDGKPIPDLMSFRQIAVALTEVTGVQVTYETIRRWCDTAGLVAPDHADEDEAPERSSPALAGEDEHTRAIRNAVARAKSSNPDIPAAAFLPPAG